jgi:hypothetical protein
MMLSSMSQDCIRLNVIGQRDPREKSQLFACDSVQVNGRDRCAPSARRADAGRRRGIALRARWRHAVVVEESPRARARGTPSSSRNRPARTLAARRRRRGIALRAR